MMQGRQIDIEVEGVSSLDLDGELYESGACGVGLIPGGLRVLL
jgi:hypothetical protein